MCMDHQMMCSCKTKSASFDFKDNIMPVEVLKNLYCPACSGSIAFDGASMVADNGWVIEYDMEVAGFMASKLPAHESITPETLFLNGYCTWRGVYPTDLVDSVKEREELKDLSKTDPKAYFAAFRNWAVGRQQRLSAEGWRKAGV